MARMSDEYQVNVGRRGITDGLIVEIARQLEKRRVVTVKLLKSYSDELDRDAVDECFETIGQLAQAIVHGEVTSEKRRGFTKTYRFTPAARKARGTVQKS